LLTKKFEEKFEIKNEEKMMLTLEEEILKEVLEMSMKGNENEKIFNDY